MKRELQDYSKGQELNIKDFIEWVDIKKNENENCEYEVSCRAMDIYREKYDCYKNGYIQKNDKGVHEIKIDDYILTADILTSIKSLCNRIADINWTSKGAELKNYILSEDNIGDFSIELKRYFYAFAIVYYWTGNMMPVKSSFQPGRYGADNWIYKMQIILDYENEGTHSDWRKWIKDKWNKKIDLFIEQNYLQDCFEQREVKNCIDSTCIINCLTNKNLEELRKNNNYYAKQLLVNHIKMIIQRSYRICNKFKGEWDDESFEPVKTIMKTVFENAGMTDEEIGEYSKTWF